MKSLKARTVILGTGFCCLYLTGSILAARTSSTTKTPIFEPGKEYHVITDNEAIGTKRFNVYVPVDYTKDRDWPVIFRYTGRGDKYNPVICLGGRMMTCDRGAIIVGMGFHKPDRNMMTPIQFINYTRQELDSVYQAKQLISRHLMVDNNRLFISGTSAGGWLASNLLEYKAQFWAGASIFVAGQHPSASVLTNRPSMNAFQDMPVFLGSALPGDSHGDNYKWAKKAESIYMRRGAIVSFEIYKKGDWLVYSPLLRDWARAYILDSPRFDEADEKTSPHAEKIEKWKRLTRTKLKDIDSTEIIKKQLIKQLNKQANQLTKTDPTGIKELSLMGENVSDIRYIANLTNLQSLDISFTYVDDIRPLLKCKSLKKLNISGTLIKDITPLKNLPRLDWLSMWNLWLDRSQVNELKEKLPDLKIPDYQWDLYEKDSTGRVLPKLKVKLD